MFRLRRDRCTHRLSQKPVCGIRVPEMPDRRDKVHTAGAAALFDEARASRFFAELVHYQSGVSGDLGLTDDAKYFFTFPQWIRRPLGR